MKKLSNTEAEFKKALLIKKSVHYICCYDKMYREHRGEKFFLLVPRLGRDAVEPYP